jgi:hypothetical protein
MCENRIAKPAENSFKGVSGIRKSNREGEIYLYE